MKQQLKKPVDPNGYLDSDSEFDFAYENPFIFISSEEMDARPLPKPQPPLKELPKSKLKQVSRKSYKKEIDFALGYQADDEGKRISFKKSLPSETKPLPKAEDNYNKPNPNKPVEIEKSNSLTAKELFNALIIGTSLAFIIVELYEHFNKPRYGLSKQGMVEKSFSAVLDTFSSLCKIPTELYELYFPPVSYSMQHGLISKFCFTALITGFQLLRAALPLYAGKYFFNIISDTLFDSSKQESSNIVADEAKVNLLNVNQNPHIAPIKQQSSNVVAAEAKADLPNVNKNPHKGSLKELRASKYAPLAMSSSSLNTLPNKKAQETLSIPKRKKIAESKEDTKPQLTPKEEIREAFNNYKSKLEHSELKKAIRLEIKRSQKLAASGDVSVKLEESFASRFSQSSSNRIELKSSIDSTPELGFGI